MSNLRRVGQPPATSTDVFGVPNVAPVSSQPRVEENIPGAGQYGFEKYKRSLEPPAAVEQISAHEAAHNARKEQERLWRENERREREQIAAYEQSKRDHNARVIAARKAAEQAAAEAVIAEVARGSMYAGWNATPEEIARIEKLVERNYRGDKSVDLRERLLLKMRNVMG